MMAAPNMDVTVADVYEFLEAYADDPSIAELLTERMASKTAACEPSAQDAGPPSLSHQGVLDGIGADSMLSSRLDSPSLSLPHLQPWNNPAVSQLPTLSSAPSPSGAQLASQLLLLQQQQQQLKPPQPPQLHSQPPQQLQEQQMQQHQIEPQHPCRGTLKASSWRRPGKRLVPGLGGSTHSRKRRGMWRSSPPVPKPDASGHSCTFARLGPCGGGRCERASCRRRWISCSSLRHRSRRSRRSRRRCSRRSRCIKCICRRCFLLRRGRHGRRSSRRDHRRSPRVNHGNLSWRERGVGRQRGAERPCRCRARLLPSGAPPHSRRRSPRRAARPAGPHPTAAARAMCACGPAAARGSTADGRWSGTHRTTRKSTRWTPPGPTRTPSWSDG